MQKPSFLRNDAYSGLVGRATNHHDAYVLTGIKTSAYYVLTRVHTP
jgi:hypothetical protein